MQELVDYLTVEPPSSCSKDRGHKYPFLALQLFSDGGDGVTEIVEKFFFSCQVVQSSSSSQPPVDSEAPGVNEHQKELQDVKRDRNSDQISQVNQTEPKEQQEFHDLMNASPQKINEDDPGAFENMIALGEEEQLPTVTSDKLASVAEAKPDVQAIFQNVENMVNLLDESEQKAMLKAIQPGSESDSSEVSPIVQKGEQKTSTAEAAEDQDDLNRDDDSMEFDFEDAIDQPLDEEELKATESQDKSATHDQQFNFDQIIEKIENPKNVKKSFELRYQNDDDDDIFIVHDGEEEGECEKEENQQQDDLFMEPPTLTFNVIDEAAKEDVDDANSPKNKKSSSEGDFEKIEFSPNDFHDAADKEIVSIGDFNPFKDNLANSEAVPVTQKLEQVMIQDNYLGRPEGTQGVEDGAMTQKLAQYGKKSPNEILSQSAKLPSDQLSSPTHPDEIQQDEAQKSRTTHQQNLKKRKQKKGLNLSIHQFDEATQKSIQDAVRQNLDEASQDREDLIPLQTSTQKKASEDPSVDRDNQPAQESKTSEEDAPSKSSKKQNLKPVVFEIVDDHIKGSQTPDQAQQPADKNEVNDFNEDELNDREESDEEKMRIKIQPIDSIDKQDGDQHEEEDNILRKQSKGLNVIAHRYQDEDKDNSESPTSPLSPGILHSAKFKEQESIELDSSSISQKIVKKQDYTLIDRFFSFLDGKVDGQEDKAAREPLNSTLSGYFCKVCLIIISQQPKELLRYVEQNDYKLIDKMLVHIDDKSICELTSRILDEIMKQLINRAEGNPTLNQENLAKSVANMQDADNNLLQQSGQSSEAVDKERKNEEMLGRARAVIHSILSDKMSEDNSYLEKLGALEIILDLLKNKVCYQMLTTKQSFQIMTRILVSDSEDSKRNIYVLLKNLIQNYEKHERFEKRINIDNFDDEELMNSHSGSGSGILNRSKKSKNSRRQNQDVLKDIQESDLFQFIRVVVQEITSSEIETRFDQIVEAKQSQKPLPLGMYFISIIEFLEKASSVFTGFINDINQTLVEKDVFNFLFEILEFYSNSDILNKTATGLVLNIMRSKSEDAPEMLKYLLEDTKLVPFLICNGPKCIQTEIKQLASNVSGSGSFTAKQNNHDQSGGSGIDESSPISPKKSKESSEYTDSVEAKGQKSPEQSSQIIEEVKPAETTAELAKRFKVQVPSKNQMGLQAHVKQISDVLIELSQVQMSTEKSGSLAKSGPEASRGANQSQSGEQSKSSEIIIEDEDQMLQQNISKVVSQNLNENSEWQSFVRNQIEPISRLLKGKLCEEQNNSTSGFMNSDNQIFDDDFMRSNSDDDKVNPEALQKLSNEFDNIISSIDNNKSRNDKQEDDDEEDDVDQKKFFKKMQECLSTNLNKKMRVERTTNMIDTHERQMKQQAFHSMEVGLSNDLRASLTDQSDDQDDLDRDPVSLAMGGRERSASSEFSLPPLQDFDDHRDLPNLDNQNLNNLMSQYKSNEKVDRLSVPHDLSAIAQVDDQEYSPQDRRAITHLADDLALDDVDINLDDSDEMEDNVNSRSDKLNNIDNDLNTFDDFATSLDQAIGNNDMIMKKNKKDLGIDIKSNRNELDDIKNIFEKIDELDNIFGSNSPEALSPDMRQEDDEAIEQPNRNNLQLPRGQEVPMNRNSFGMSKSEVIVQMNNLMDSGEDPDGSNEGHDLFGAASPDRDQEDSPKEQENEDDGDFNQREDNHQITDKQINDNILNKDTFTQKKFEQEKQYSMVHNVFATHKSLSKSVYVPPKNKGLLDDEETKVEFLDNNFWKLDNLMTSNYNLDDLLDDMMQGEMPKK